MASLPREESERLTSRAHRLARLCCSFGLPHLVATRAAQAPFDLADQQLLAPQSSVLQVPAPDVTKAFATAQSQGRSCSWLLPLPNDERDTLRTLASILSPLASRLLVYGGGAAGDIVPLLLALRPATSAVCIVQDAIRGDISFPDRHEVITFAQIEAAHDAL
jgi:hypothetical protein